MIKRFIKYYKPHLRLFFIDMFCALIISGIDLFFPIVTNKTLKEYYNNTNVVLWIGGGLVVIFAIKFYLGYVIGYYGHIMGMRLETDMRSDLYKKFQSMDYQYFDDKKTGELMTNLTTHLNDVSEMSHHAPEDLFISFIMIIGSFIILCLMNWLLTLIVFVSLTGLVIYSLTRRLSMRRGFRASRTAQGELNAKIESSLSGITLTKAFNNQKLEIKKFEEFNKQYKESRFQTFKAIGLFSSGNEFFINLANLSLLVFGCVFIALEGSFDIIDLATYFLYVSYLIKPIARLTNSIEQIEQGFSGIEKFHQIMEIQPLIVNQENPLYYNDFQGDIEFINVSFQYEQSESSHVLNNFNLHIKKGQKIALVGETGVGKSTISKLVPRFYDITEGKILIDGYDIKEYDISCLRNAIGHVQQEVFIFYGTILDNIIYGKPDASEEEIIQAAKAARIHDYIISLENKYQTMVGERGIKLSGGQKQRIAIARLFLKNPKILILDEATSALDNITESLIQSSLDELSSGRTTITIAHRLSTIKNADEIIVLGKNGIIEKGTHHELLQNGGYYARLYETTLTI